MRDAQLSDWLEKRAGDGGEAALLWPRTPIGDEIQDRIRERVGVSDFDSSDPRSRPKRIVSMLRRLSALPSGFSVLDIACGDALVLTSIKREFPEADVHGIDINVGAFAKHSTAEAAGVHLHRVSIQALFAEDPPRPFDVALMLNTYRGWESADLPEAEQDLPAVTDIWLRNNAGTIFLTAKPEQLEGWTGAGWSIADLGRGEDQSRLVCLSRDRLPSTSIIRLRARLGF